jgi:hypothetical protein
MEAQHRAEVCSVERAYERGMNDGQNSQPMDSSFTSFCDLDVKAQVSKSYQDGYKAAVGPIVSHPNRALDNCVFCPDE